VDVTLPIDLTSLPVSSNLLKGEDLAFLRSKIQGQVFTPDEAGYAAAVASWSLNTRHVPLLVVLAESAADVAAAVRFASERDLPVGVQATGHGSPVACVGGILINTTRMQGVTIDSDKQSARVEAGAKWSAVIPLAQEHGLAPLSGSSTDVGVVGYTLGGGTGWLARQYGRAADRIIAADLVTADGNLVQVSRDSHPDLFWAIHGGSSNFGIVTSLEFGLVPVERVYGGSVMYPLEMAREVFAAFNTWTASLPESITATITIMRFPPLPFLPPMLQGVAAVIVRACAVGDLAAGEASIAPMRSLGAPILDTFDTMPFTAIDAISMDPVEPLPAVGRTLTLPSLDAETVDVLLSVAGPGIESPVLMFEIRHLTNPAAGHRLAPDDAAFSVYAVGITPAPEAKTAVERALEEFGDALASHASSHVLLNFLGDGDVGELRTRAAFSETDYLRMQEIKAIHDPGNRFRFNHNIAPAR
jgi:FAD/FMN-containing dehydrogenase